MDDLAERWFDLYEKGDISKYELYQALGDIINATGDLNGYTELYGSPCED